MSMHHLTLLIYWPFSASPILHPTSPVDCTFKPRTQQAYCKELNSDPPSSFPPLSTPFAAIIRHSTTPLHFYPIIRTHNLKLVNTITSLCHHIIPNTLKAISVSPLIRFKPSFYLHNIEACRKIMLTCTRSRKILGLCLLKTLPLFLSWEGGVYVEGPA